VRTVGLDCVCRRFWKKLLVIAQRVVVKAMEAPATVRVSVIMPAYNTEQWIEGALRSVLDQTMTDLEVIVVDDGSTDRTGDRVEALAASDSRIRLIRSERNRGPSAARNLALDAARGEWVALLDSDDRFRPDRLEVMIAAADAAGAEIVADNLVRVSEQGEQVGLTWPEIDEPVSIDAEQFALRNLWGARNPFGLAYAQPLFRRRLISETGIRFRADIHLLEDYHFILALLRQGPMLILPVTMYYCTIRTNSLSRSPFREQDLMPVVDAGRELIAAAHTPGLRAALMLQQRSVELRLTRVRCIAAIRQLRLIEALAALSRQPQALMLVVRHLVGSAAMRLRLRQ
jgi:succinoglycan biosynthesis protein ExoO